MITRVIFERPIPLGCAWPLQLQQAFESEQWHINFGEVGPGVWTLMKRATGESFNHAGTPASWVVEHATIERAEPLPTAVTGVLPVSPCLVKAPLPTKGKR